MIKIILSTTNFSLLHRRLCQFGSCSSLELIISILICLLKKNPQNVEVLPYVHSIIFVLCSLFLISIIQSVEYLYLYSPEYCFNTFGLLLQYIKF